MQNDAKNKPLVEDIRLLGRILGNVIREQEGNATFQLIERVRRLSVAYRLKKDVTAGRTLSRLLTRLSNDKTVSYPICVYPLKAQWNGRDSAKSAASYSCQ